MASENDDGDELEPVQKCLDIVTQWNKGEIEGEEREIAEKMGRVAADATEAEKADIVELIAQHCDYTKKVSENIVDEQAWEAEKARVTVHRITEVHPPDISDEDVRYIWHVSVDGEECRVKMTSSQLMNSAHEFEKQIFQATRRRFDVDDWDQWVDSVFQKVPIKEREEEPITKEHGVARDVLQELESLRCTRDKEEWKKSNDVYIYAAEGDPTEGEVWVDGSVVQRKCKEVRGETSARKVRSILDDYLVGSSTPVRRDGDMFRYWTFDAEKLASEGIEIGGGMDE